MLAASAFQPPLTDVGRAACARRQHFEQRIAAETLEQQRRQRDANRRVQIFDPKGEKREKNAYDLQSLSREARNYFALSITRARARVRAEFAAAAHSQFAFGRFCSAHARRV